MTSQTTSFMLQKDFKVWMCATLGLLKDGKMGASQGRADRIKRAQQWVQVMLYSPLSGCCLEYSQDEHVGFVLSVIVAKAFG